MFVNLIYDLIIPASYKNCVRPKSVADGLLQDRHSYIYIYIYIC